MQGPCRHIECPGIYERMTPLTGRDHRELGEPDVIAYAKSDPGKVGVKVVSGPSAGEGRTLLESDLAWDVDVEEVNFAMDGDEVTCTCLFRYQKEIYEANKTDPVMVVRESCVVSPPKTTHLRRVYRSSIVYLTIRIFLRNRSYHRSVMST
jgi:hypothetical protein